MNYCHSCGVLKSIVRERLCGVPDHVRQVTTTNCQSQYKQIYIKHTTLDSTDAFDIKLICVDPPRRRHSLFLVLGIVCNLTLENTLIRFDVDVLEYIDGTLVDEEDILWGVFHTLSSSSIKSEFKT